MLNFCQRAIMGTKRRFPDGPFLIPTFNPHLSMNILKATGIFFRYTVLIALTAILLHAKTFAQDNIVDSPQITSAGTTVIFPEILTGSEEQSLEYIENFSDKRRAYLIRTFTKGKKYFAKAAAVLKKYKVPQEFKVLMALESGFRHDAISKAGAVGYWQFMDEAAKEYGLKIVPSLSADEKKKLIKKDKKKAEEYFKAQAKQKDDRKNLLKSTYAAARYLKDRAKNLNNDWLLVAASYNCGIGNVWDAMQASGMEQPTFWDIKNLLPAETQTYVMNFIALNVVFNNYEKFADNSLFIQAEKNTQSLSVSAIEEKKAISSNKK